MLCILLAPGPSMSQGLVDELNVADREYLVGVINNVYELAPWADFMVANDANWWRKHSQARMFAGKKFSAGDVKGVARVLSRCVGVRSNSGVVALEVARQLGATKIALLGFDMQGTHYFGRYKNGCTNTSAGARVAQMRQFMAWDRANKGVDVVNCTPRSKLDIFPQAEFKSLIGKAA